MALRFQPSGLFLENTIQPVTPFKNNNNYPGPNPHSCAKHRVRRLTFAVCSDPYNTPHAGGALGISRITKPRSSGVRGPARAHAASERQGWGGRSGFLVPKPVLFSLDYRLSDKGCSGAHDSL